LTAPRQQRDTKRAGQRNAGGHVETNRVEGVHGHSVVMEKAAIRGLVG
jgi:hypothetical protein